MEISWDAQEGQFLGFLIFRSTGIGAPEDAYKALNPKEPVPGRGPRRFRDRDVPPGEVYAYKISALLCGGGVDLFGPVSLMVPEPGPSTLVPPCPNPAGGEAALRFVLPRVGEAQLSLYDPTGRCVRRLFGGLLPAREHRVVWDGLHAAGRNLPSGVYQVRPVCDGRVASGNAILIRK